MSTLITQEPPQTLAELVARLDGVALERIRNVPTPGTATEADLLRALDHDKILCELIDGTLVEKPLGWDEADIAGEILHRIKSFLEQHGLRGFVLGPDGPYRITKSRVRLPDVTYVPADRVPPKGSRPPIADWCPELAVEVLSVSNRPGEMAGRLRDYFAAGVSLVWFVDHLKRTIRVFTSPDEFVEFGDDDTLDGGDVLPGFSLSVRELFDRV